MKFDREMCTRGGMNMPKYPDEMQEPVEKAAKMALETGNVNYILIWLPEESENTLKNLLEKTCCKRSSKMNMRNQAYDWYFETVNRFYRASRWPDYLMTQFGGLAKKMLILKVDRAIESGNFEEIRDIIPVTHEADAKQRFQLIMNMRNYPVNNIQSGRAYVSAFFDFARYIHTLSSSIPGKYED
jgi:hypothetical protein